MLASPHAAAGIALGALIGNPIVVVPAALASHFLLDSVPHWQATLAPYTPTWKTYVQIPVDIALAVGLSVWAAHMLPMRAPSIWAGAAAANAPDLDTLVVIIPGIKKGFLQWYWDWHCRIQRETSSLWGVMPQLIVVATALVAVRLL